MPFQNLPTIARRCVRSLVATLLTTCAGSVVFAQAQTKPLLTPADYDQFEFLYGGVLSPNGRWLAHSILKVNDTSQVHIRRVSGGDATIAAWGSGPVFAPSSRWVSYTAGVSPTERQRLERDKKPVRSAVVLRELETGHETRFEQVASRTFDKSGKYLALLGYAPEEPKGKGADLRVVTLQDGEIFTFGNVAEYAWSDNGSMLAFTVATGAASGNGVQLYDIASGRLTLLDASGMTYKQIAWRKGANDLAAFRSHSVAGVTGTRQTLLAWRNVQSAIRDSLKLDTVLVAGADSLEIVEYEKPRWSPDGSRIAIGLRTVPAKANSDTTTLPGVQIWHPSDVLIVPQQQSRAAATARRTRLAVWEPATRRLVPISSRLAENAILMEGMTFGIERLTEPYPFGAKFGRRYHDVDAVNVATGRRTRVVDSTRYSYASGAGNYVMWFDGRDYWTHDVRTGKRTNITVGVPAMFADTTDDKPTDIMAPFGVAGWIEKDAAVLVHDQFDVWRIAPDGSRATRLTRGVEDSVEHRLVALDASSPVLDATKPLYLSVRGARDQKSGYARVVPGRPVERLLLEDKYIWGLVRADSTDVFMYRSEARDDSPDYFVGGPVLSNARQVTSTNLAQAKYAWTHSELLKFRSDSGDALQGVLLYPANHDPQKKYPMIVYAYEKLSQELHSYQAPDEDNYYNFTAWTQQGYFVLLPDIKFRARDPGVSLLEALRPAVRSVVNRGLVDSARVGFVGHSWGGYHATYAATHSTLFAASIAGAPLTDFTSFMGQIHWNAGTPESDHWETGQARMQVPYWEDKVAHERNSPVHNVQNMTTPLLLAHGNKDGTVEFFQSTEFYNFARRAGKQVVLLVYEGEDHSFQKPANRKDYHRRIGEWFGHYLKGEPAPEWITRGVSLEALEAEKRRVLWLKPKRSP